jgi:two-component system response regulator
METPAEILLVEDNINDAELSIYALKKYKIATRIHHARDGAEALYYIFGSEQEFEKIPLRMPRLILLDLKLPKIDGQEVLRKIKNNLYAKNIPVVILSSSREEGDITRCYGSGANSYVVKPIDFDRFTEAVRDVGLYWLYLNQVQVQL